VKGSDTNCECGCEMIYHLRQEDEYEQDALEDLDEEFEWEDDEEDEADA